jgi:hypothetical protein
VPGGDLLPADLLEAAGYCSVAVADGNVRRHLAENAGEASCWPMGADVTERGVVPGR